MSVNKEPPSKRTSNNALRIFIGVLFLIGVGVVAFIGINYGFGTNNAAHEVSHQVTTVVYEITGTASKVAVTLNNSTGGTEQYSDVAIPKRFTYYAFQDSFLYVSAQNQGEYGTVTVNIYVNENLLKTASSSGAYVIATASGTNPYY
jgi:hypothetical protein